MSETILIVRTCKANGTSSGGFAWPESGPVQAPDWDPTPRCGGGLHGLAWGVGDGRLLDWSEDARWLLVEVAAADVVDLDGKVKFPRGVVLACGARVEVLGELQRRAPQTLTLPVVGATRIAGDRGTATAGDEGTATAGYEGTATAGYGGTATAGDGGTATAGYEGTATAGDRGRATAGDGGRVTAGNGGTATAGDGGTATAGNGGTATAGYGGTATAGYRGRVTAGNGGVVVVAWWDATSDRRRLTVGCVGKEGILPGVAYRVDDSGRLVAMP